MPFLALQAEHSKARSTRSVIAIDMGFARANRSCGIAWQNIDTDVVQSAETDFGGAIKLVARKLQTAPTDVVLIVEAPLSGAFDRYGNPEPRGQFEITDSKRRQNSPRYWYTGPGASTALAAVYFLQQISRRLSKISSRKRIHIVEGFASRYSKPRPTHRCVAKALVAEWGRKQTKLIEPQSKASVSILQILDGARRATPAILRLPDGMCRTTKP